MRRLGAIAVCLFLAACGGEEERGAASSCLGSRPDAPLAAVDGLLSPVRPEVESVDGTPDRLRVRGFVSMSSGAFLDAVRGREGWRVVFSENEADEAELLFDDGRHSNFWRVRDACVGGSTFEAAVAPGRTSLGPGDLG